MRLLFGIRTRDLFSGYRVLSRRFLDTAPLVATGFDVEAELSVQAQVNGAPVSMLVDTGASSVVLTQEAAKAANLPLDMLKYDVPIDTASGRTRAAAVVLDRIAVGGIVERRVPALISAPGDLRTSLLGMTFLETLTRYSVTQNSLELVD